MSKQKELTIKRIMGLLDVSYKSKSAVYQTVEKELYKLTNKGVSALYSMILTASILSKRKKCLGA